MRTPAQVRAVAAPRMGRAIRSPQHPFQIRQRPWQITPFFIAPVLPGETLKNLMWQSRAVTDPINNPIVGWWMEYYFFYVKHRDLAERAAMEQMMLDPAWDNSAIDAPASVENHYHFGATNRIDWVDLCLKRICAGDDKVNYFRNTSEPWNVATLDGLPLAAITGDTVWDSLRPDAEFDSDDVEITVGGDGIITSSEIDQAMRTWEQLTEMGMTDMSYEDYLATFGMKTQREESHVPELVRFVRRWSYPSNTIDPANGTPRSAVSWSIAERGDKARFFKEPGFLIGLTVCRPKVYLKNQKGSVTGGLNSLEKWLPALMAANPQASLASIPDNGLLGDITDANGAWYDVKDLFLYGEQFVNFDLASTGKNIVALPTAGLQRRYVSDTDVDALFVTPNVAASEYIRQDGLVSLSISGRQWDTSVTRTP